MTREEEIENFAASQMDCEYWDDSEYNGIILGAKWADEHPNEESRKEYIKKIVRIFNENFPNNDGAIVWLETDEDYEDVANKIIELEKLYEE